MRVIFTAFALAIAAGTGAIAQQDASSRSEISQRLNQAATNRQQEEARSGSLDATRSMLANTAEKARSELAQPVPPEQAVTEAAGKQRMAEALNGLSPEGKALLAQSSEAAPLLKVPTAAPAGGAAAPAAAGGPKPRPLKPEPLTEPPPPDSKQTVIVGDLTFFDSGNNIAVFVGNVVVDSPQFHITCDEFEVHMRKQAKDAPADGKPGPDGKTSAKGAGTAKAGPAAAKGTPAPKAGTTPAPKPDVRTLAVTAPATVPGSADGKPAKPVYNADNPADNSIESAIAKGRKVVIIKHNPDGKIQIGQSRYAYYDGNTGDITLRQSPQVQDGDDLHIALEPTTVMILTQAGALHTTGRATTKLMQQNQDNTPNGAKPGASGTPAAPGTAPASGAAPGTARPATNKGGLSLPGPVPGQ